MVANRYYVYKKHKNTWEVYIVKTIIKLSVAVAMIISYEQRVHISPR